MLASRLMASQSGSVTAFLFNFDDMTGRDDVSSVADTAEGTAY